jgi:pyruvate kinase
MFMRRFRHAKMVATLGPASSDLSTIRALSMRERPRVPVVGITPERETARRLALVRGVHAVHAKEGVVDVTGMIAKATEAVRDEGFAVPGDTIVIAAGMPFGTAGTTNLLHIAQA